MRVEVTISRSPVRETTRIRSPAVGRHPAPGTAHTRPATTACPSQPSSSSMVARQPIRRPDAANGSSRVARQDRRPDHHVPMATAAEIGTTSAGRALLPGNEC
jgi:hypothetical protein